jgi:hypothetical protein
MRLTTFGVTLGFLLCAALAQAQIKASGALKCNAPDINQKAAVAANHAYVLSQAKCMSDPDKPFTIEGVKSSEAVSTNVTEVHGNKATFHGTYMDTMDNGDKAEYSFHGTGTMKDGAMTMADDFWTLVWGTGKLKGAKGKGTCKGSAAADGSATWDCEGEYTLASK